ncbi:MAG TPA: hypothetical protein VFS19_05425, partial [Planctomycetota bacterium]|nr:hypothetical protein [Planctomycetota bacterium]
GALDLPPTFECLDDVFYPTLHHFRLPEGAYFPDEVNRFTLTMFAASTLGASVGICEPPGHAVAMRFFVRPYVDERERRNAPTYPQAVVLMDVTTGTILRPGVAIDSPDLQIMAVLADPDGDMAALEIEYQLVGSDEIGTMTIQSQQFEPGTQVVVQLPSLGPGLWLIRVRAIDSTGEVSPWVPVDPVIRVARFGVQQTYTGVSRAEVEDALRVIPIDSGISLEVRDSGSGGGACSAGARFGTDGVLAGIAVLILIGAARRRLA